MTQDAFETDERAATADRVEISRSSLGEVRGRDVEVEQSAVRSVHAERLEMEQSAVIVARATDAELQSSAIGVLAAREVQAEQLTALFVLAPVVRGNVRTLFDLRTAIAVGAGFFLARRALRLFGDARRALLSSGNPE